MQCAEIDKFIHAYVDGEFAEDDRVEFERHLAECARCREAARFEVRFKQTLRAQLPRPPVPPGLRERIVAEIAAAPVPGVRWQRVVYPTVGLAAAASIAAVFFLSGGSSPVTVVKESIQRHQRNLPVEVVGPEGDRVSSWFRGKVDIPVRPPRLRLAGADLLGGRISHVRDRQAAHLVYNVRGQKVSVLIFDPRNLPLQARHLRRIRNRNVYFDRQAGYNVAVYRQGDVGYAIASDLPERDMVQLVSAAVE